MVSGIGENQVARFFDTRAAYMLFVTATDEKTTVAERISREVKAIEPGPPGLRILDAGMGDATVLSHLMRRTHRMHPHIPWFVLAKEISIEDVRQALAKLPDRLFEHPEMVFAVTNMKFSETPTLTPSDGHAPIWREVAVEGTSTDEFADQIRDLYRSLAEDWAVETSVATGNPVYRTPAVLVVYRKDREFLLRDLIPKPGRTVDGFDLVIASQIYRAKTPVERKVSTVILPLARALAPGGRLVGLHSHGRDAGTEIIHGVWPNEDPFPHDRHDIMAEAKRQLSEPADSDLEFPELADAESVIRYRMHAMPSQEAEHIGTSMLVAAFNAAAYVAQIDEERLSAAMASGSYLEPTRQVIESHTDVWFQDELYLIIRKK